MDFRTVAAVLVLATSSSSTWAVDVDEVIARLVGTFVGGDADATQEAIHAELRVASLPGRTVYMQWRGQGNDAGPGELTRQRLWTLTEDHAGARLSFHTFRDNTPFVDLQQRPLAAMALSRDELRSYPEGCAMRLAREGERLVGTVSEADCVMDLATSGHDLSLAYSMELDADGFEFSETAYFPDGSVAYRMPETGTLRFTRR